MPTTKDQTWQRPSPEPFDHPFSLKRLFERKHSNDLINASTLPGRCLKKALSAWDLVLFGIGAIIGSGIFALTGTAAAGQLHVTNDIMSTPLVNFMLGSSLGREGAGPAIVISFLIAGFACAMAALCYAELASSIPVSGSAYTFSFASLGRLPAWIIGWDLILEYAVGAVAVAIGWSGYFVHLIHGLTGLKFPLWMTTDTTTALAKSAAMSPQQQALYSDLTLPTLLGHPVAINFPAVAIIGVITWLLCLGVGESSKVNAALVVTKVAVVLFFICMGSFYINPANWVPFAPTGLAGIMGGAAIVFFAFIGFDAVSATAEEATDPQRDLPIGIIGSLIICTILYIAVSLVLTGMLPFKTYAGDPAAVATALASTGQPMATIIVTLGAVAGMSSVLLVLLFSQPRIFMAMARDGFLPSRFAEVHSRYCTPILPTIITGSLVALFAGTIDIGQAAELTNIGTLAAFILVCTGVMILRKTEPDKPRPFTCPLVPLVPVLGIVSCLALMCSLPIVTWVRFAVWMAIGLTIFAFYGHRSSLIKTSSQ